MPRKRPDLTKSEQQRIRANISRQATQIGNRLADYAMGKDGVTMSSAQVRAALGLLGHTLPSMQSTEVTDLTPTVTYQDVEAQYAAALQTMTMTDLRALLAAIPEDERQELLGSLGETVQ